MGANDKMTKLVKVISQTEKCHIDELEILYNFDFEYVEPIDIKSNQGELNDIPLWVNINNAREMLINDSPRTKPSTNLGKYKDIYKICGKLYYTCKDKATKEMVFSELYPTIKELHRIPKFHHVEETKSVNGGTISGITESDFYVEPFVYHKNGEIMLRYYTENTDAHTIHSQTVILGRGFKPVNQTNYFDVKSVNYDSPDLLPKIDTTYESALICETRFSIYCFDQNGELVCELPGFIHHKLGDIMQYNCERKEIIWSHLQHITM